MIGFEISLNGTRLCTAGLDRPGAVKVLTAWVLRNSQEDRGGVRGTTADSVSVSIDGEVWEPQELVEWTSTRLMVGDEVSVRVVDMDVESFEEPYSYGTIDPEVVKANLRKQYERLKLMFDPQ